MKICTNYSFILFQFSISYFLFFGNLCIVAYYTFYIVVITYASDIV